MMRKIILAVIFIIIVSCSISMPVKSTIISQPRTSPHIVFHWEQNNESYIGYVISLTDYLRLDKARISLYDDKEKLMESGLLSEYVENREFGYYFEFWDVAQNNKVDASDIFIISGTRVNEDWGFVITYTLTGKAIYSRTLSNEHFSVSVEEGKENDRDIFILIFEVNVFGLLVILVYIYSRKN